jgi:hypothetical protein
LKHAHGALQESLERVRGPDPDWDLLLDSQSPYKLLYSLQILEGLMQPAVRASSAAPRFIGEPADARVQAEGEPRPDDGGEGQWRRRFLLAGGFLHLYRIALSAQSHPQPGGEESSLAVIQKKSVSLLIGMVK